MMKPSPVTPEFESLTEKLSAEGAEAGKMFGMPCLKIGGKAFAGTYDSELVFKLHGDAHAEALAMRGAHLFDPSGSGRAMKEWVVVPGIASRDAERFGRHAMEYALSVSQRPSRTTRKK